MPNQHTVTTGIRHGTNAGYQMHYRLNIPIDDLDTCGCRMAHAKYNSDHRGGSPRLVSSTRERELVRSRAYRKLARMFPAEFRRVVDEEQRKRDLELLRQEDN